MDHRKIKTLGSLCFQTMTEAVYLVSTLCNGLLHTMSGLPAEDLNDKFVKLGSYSSGGTKILCK